MTPCEAREFFFMLVPTDLFASLTLRPCADAIARRGSLGARLPAGSRCDLSHRISSARLCSSVFAFPCVPAFLLPRLANRKIERRGWPKV